ncbi:Hsp20/alpha crystallin family protein [Polyangium sp. 15x6]|uniref:Hsp20/alpha crystallin family protein n=1 Tax=Polyangium sp. 15x6 TaxID=3042687 RepID=UPI00249AC2B9|nr:Hsp20/alpha crystallin family protein [Polyangium sp. 15x6]MDI3282363.1 Hsp20/alpha crystallin family protein [Polyangium sp. 15x6]
MLNVEQAIAEVAGVYQSLTGRAIKPGRYELPPEVDPATQAESNYRQFKALLEQKARASAEPRGKGEPAFAPPVDVVELEREVRVMVDVPGVTREQIVVSVAGDALTIRGERGALRSAAGMMRLEERRKGPILRTIALPPRARRDGIEATLREGVLTVVIPTDGHGNDVTEVPIDVK